MERGTVPRSGILSKHKGTVLPVKHMGIVLMCFTGRTISLCSLNQIVPHKTAERSQRFAAALFKSFKTSS